MLIISIELLGSQSHNSSTQKLPYGLNHRRSLEDIGASGNLKIFSPIAKFKKKGMFANKNSK